MNAVIDQQTLEQYMQKLGEQARAASVILANAEPAKKNQALQAIADALLAQRDAIKQANNRDLEQGRQAGLDAAMLDRLALNDER
ncbi:MAG: gamma-glutamyl-phosphate reductase, partial [Gammaproteobacteria bacterium]|nr:gamma-glutamyl-phosphate reductase [Gammaproteobacteria bacterium]